MNTELLKKGDKFKVDVNCCHDVNLVNWYIENNYPILTVKSVEDSTIFIDECEFGIEMIETYKVD